MGIRSRNGEKKSKEELKNKLHHAQKEFTRAKALRELANGADFNDEKFTHHRNHHVRYRAWMMAGGMVPETEQERKALAGLLSRGRTPAGVLAIEQRLRLNKPADETRVKAA